MQPYDMHTVNIKGDSYASQWFLCFSASFTVIVMLQVVPFMIVNRYLHTGMIIHYIICGWGNLSSQWYACIVDIVTSHFFFITKVVTTKNCLVTNNTLLYSVPHSVSYCDTWRWWWSIMTLEIGLQNVYFIIIIKLLAECTQLIMRQLIKSDIDWIVNEVEVPT